jgi:hypothetical protein
VPNDPSNKPELPNEYGGGQLDDSHYEIVPGDPERAIRQRAHTTIRTNVDVARKLCDNLRDVGKEALADKIFAAYDALPILVIRNVTFAVVTIRTLIGDINTAIAPPAYGDMKPGYTLREMLTLLLELLTPLALSMHPTRKSGPDVGAPQPAEAAPPPPPPSYPPPSPPPTAVTQKVVAELENDHAALTAKVKRLEDEVAAAQANPANSEPAVEMCNHVFHEAELQRAIAGLAKQTAVNNLRDIVSTFDNRLQDIEDAIENIKGAPPATQTEPGRREEAASAATPNAPSARDEVFRQLQDYKARLDKLEGRFTDTGVDTPPGTLEEVMAGLKGSVPTQLYRSLEAIKVMIGRTNEEGAQSIKEQQRELADIRSAIREQKQTIVKLIASNGAPATVSDTAAEETIAKLNRAIGEVSKRVETLESAKIAVAGIKPRDERSYADIMDIIESVQTRLREMEETTTNDVTRVSEEANSVRADMVDVMGKLVAWLDKLVGAAESPSDEPANTATLMRSLEASITSIIDRSKVLDKKLYGVEILQSTLLEAIASAEEGFATKTKLATEEMEKTSRARAEALETKVQKTLDTRSAEMLEVIQDVKNGRRQVEDIKMMLHKKGINTGSIMTMAADFEVVKETSVTLTTTVKRLEKLVTSIDVTIADIKKVQMTFVSLETFNEFSKKITTTTNTQAVSIEAIQKFNTMVAGDLSAARAYSVKTDATLMSHENLILGTLEIIRDILVHGYIADDGLDTINATFAAIRKSALFKQEDKEAMLKFRQATHGLTTVRTNMYTSFGTTYQLATVSAPTGVQTATVLSRAAIAPAGVKAENLVPVQAPQQALSPAVVAAKIMEPVQQQAPASWDEAVAKVFSRENMEATSAAFAEPRPTPVAPMSPPRPSDFEHGSVGAKFGSTGMAIERKTVSPFRAGVGSSVSTNPDVVLTAENMVDRNATEEMEWGKSVAGMRQRTNGSYFFTPPVETVIGHRVMKRDLSDDRNYMSSEELEAEIARIEQLIAAEQSRRAEARYTSDYTVTCHTIAHDAMQRILSQPYGDAAMRQLAADATVISSSATEEDEITQVNVLALLYSVISVLQFFWTEVLMRDEVNEIDEGMFEAEIVDDVEEMVSYTLESLGQATVNTDVAGIANELDILKKENTVKTPKTAVYMYERMYAMLDAVGAVIDKYSRKKFVDVDMQTSWRRLVQNLAGMARDYSLLFKIERENMMRVYGEVTQAHKENRLAEYLYKHAGMDTIAINRALRMFPVPDSDAPLPPKHQSVKGKGAAHAY